VKRDPAGHPRRAGGGGAGATKSRFGHGDAPKPRRTSSCLLTVAKLAAVELRCKSLQESEAFRSERGSW